MRITLFGAAGDVTGTAYYILTEKARIMVDCGIFQGGKKSEVKNRKAPPLDYRSLNAILLTHAHLDHCGRLPLTIREGFSGPIYATPATIDLTALILRDALKVQTYDLEKLNRMRVRQGKAKVEAPYDDEDVEKIIRLMRPLPYHEAYTIAEDLQVIVDEAGHIMGSGSLKLIATENGVSKSVVFSGDLGPKGLPIVRDSEPFREADMVFMESTYGDRDHKPLQDTIDETIEIIRQALQTKGKILVPSFAVGRTQDIIYYIEQAFRKGGLPRFPIYIDSPMAIEASRIYMSHAELFDDEMKEFVSSGEMQRDKGFIHPTPSAEESKKLNDLTGPCMIIAGSGMCNAGRILHHLRHNLWNSATSVLIVGYQAKGTLGRKLVDGAESVKIYGESIAVHASIHKLGGFSAHAGQTDLLNWFNALAPCRPKVVLTHGEDRGRIPLAKILEEQYGIRALLPQYGESIDL